MVTGGAITAGWNAEEQAGAPATPDFNTPKPAGQHQHSGRLFQKSAACSQQDWTCPQLSAVVATPTSILEAHVLPERAFVDLLLHQVVKTGIQADFNTQRNSTSHLINWRMESGGK